MYKQLYRAAKAKLKLRIRATLVTDGETLDTKHADAPQGGPVECLHSQRFVPASKSDDEAKADLSSQPTPAATETTPVNNVTAPVNRPIPAVQAKESLQRQAYDLYMNSITTPSLHDAFVQRFGSERNLPIPAQALAKSSMPMKQEKAEGGPVLEPHRAYPSCFWELAGVPPNQNEKVRAGDHALNIHGSYSVFCNECDRAIPGAHYHCGICDDGDFDLCQSCVDSGVLCGVEGHWLIKRVVRDGKVMNSTTETIAPKSIKVEKEKEMPGAYRSSVKDDDDVEVETRTCNSCVRGELYRPCRASVEQL